jgi:hypothetical protein
MLQEAMIALSDPPAAYLYCYTSLCLTHFVIVRPRCKPDVLVIAFWPISLTLLKHFSETHCGFDSAVRLQLRAYVQTGRSSSEGHPDSTL